MAVPILFGTSGLAWGVTAASGGILQNITWNNRDENTSIRNEVGQTCAMAFHDPNADVDFSLYTTGTSGLSAAAPALALSLGNNTNPLTSMTGTVITTEVSYKKTNTTYQMIDGKAKQYPLF